MDNQIVVFIKDDWGRWMAFIVDESKPVDPNVDMGNYSPHGVQGLGNTMAEALIDLGIAMEQAEIPNGTKDGN